MSWFARTFAAVAAALAEESLPVSAGELTVAVRRPWSAGRAVTVSVRPGGSATVDA